jgi:hypothetical protein
MTFGLAPVTSGGVTKAVFTQTNDRFGAVTNARSPRVQQASIRLNF